jgi:hypothetical protein
VHSQRVGEVERRRALVAEFPDAEVIVMARLRRELDFEDGKELLLSLTPVIADH